MARIPAGNDRGIISITPLIFFDECDDHPSACAKSCFVVR
jgi:hypothetical protein